MKLNKFAPQKKTAQAMVEFAIVLPILLLLLYGILETGRLLFMYSSIVTASRQAVRYGSANGDGTTPGVPRFRDCTGIRQAANAVDYLNAFDHTSIDVMISWDTGDGSTVHPICPTGQASDTWIPPGNTSRLIVTVTGHFNPIVRLVPFGARTIVATSRRTILVSVPIVVNAPGATTPLITIADTPDPSEMGEPIPLVVTVTDPTATGIPTGTIDLSYNGTLITGCTGLPLTAGTVTCPNVAFYSSGNITAAFTSTDPTYASTSGTEPHDVGPTPVEIIVSDNPVWSMPGQSVNIQVTVRSPHDPSVTVIVPTGSVIITNGEDSCTLSLSGGVTGCSLVFNATGTRTITATYTSDDLTKYDSDTGTDTHDVLTNTPTASNTPPPPPPTATPTFTPMYTATTTSTATVTPVPNCELITNQGGIQFNNDTMYLDILNPNTYSVSISSIYVVWNWDDGWLGGDGHLWLKSVKLGATTIWSGNENVPQLTLNFAPPVTLLGNGTSRLTFTFAHKYNFQGGEEIQVNFLTPGCEQHPIHVKH